ncbi:unnamed protein product [Natator depressus]
MFAPHCSLIAISEGEGAFPPLAVCPTRVSFPLKSRAPPPGPFSASSHPLGWASGDASSPMLALCPGDHNQPARPAPAIRQKQSKNNTSGPGLLSNSPCNEQPACV